MLIVCAEKLPAVATGVVPLCFTEVHVPRVSIRNIRASVLWPVASHGAA